MDAVFDDGNDEGATNADTVSVRAAAPSNANVGNFIVSSNRYLVLVIDGEIVWLPSFEQPVYGCM